MADQVNDSREVVVPSRPNPYCDGCNKPITTIRHKCQQCPDFDYCSACVLNAAQIHPHHDFTALDYMTVLPDDVQNEWRLKRGNNSKSDATYRLTGRSTGLPAQVCQSCIGVTKMLAALPCILQDPKMQQKIGPRQFAINWVVRIASLVTATQKGCAFCSIVLQRFFAAHNGRTITFESERLWYTEPDQQDSRAELVAHAMKTLARLEKDRFEFQVSPKYTNSLSDPPNYDMLEISFVKADVDQKTLASIFPSKGQQYISFHVFSASGTPTADIIQSRPPNSAPASEDGLSTVREWLRECEENHPQCRRSLDLETVGHPKHLIDVSAEDGMLKLYKAESYEITRYAALSYCWGGPQESCLTKKNYQNRLTGFLSDDLPATLRDAIHVTQKTGLQYLWVDSLCIVQDDADDKASQLDIMGNIYRDACLTICAAKAGGAGTGFLYDSSDPDTGLRKDMIPLGYPMPNPKATDMETAMKMPNETFGTLWLMEEQPLWSSAGESTSGRGWCLQEKYLSTRYLQYGRWPIWRCNGAAVSDGGWYYEKNASNNQLAHFIRDIHKPQSELSDPSMDHFSVQQLMQTWQALVAEFTKRALSIYTDKLPAIAGIAAEIQRRSRAQYCAGLWRNNLLFNLMWHAKTAEWLTRYETPIAPTWSWASVNCPVTYGHITEDAIPLARALDCQTTQETTMSAVTGHVVLNGLVRQVQREDVLKLLARQRMARAPPKNNDVNQWYRQMLEDFQLNPKNAPKENEIQQKLPDRVFAILTYTRDWFVRFEERIEKPCYSGLLLEESPNGEFLRIGCFVNETEEWMMPEDSGWETRTIHIN